MVSEHMLTVGRDPRNWQAHRKDFSLQLSFQKNLLPLFSSELIQIFLSSDTIPLSLFDHTKIRLMTPLCRIESMSRGGGVIRLHDQLKIYPFPNFSLWQILAILAQVKQS